MTRGNLFTGATRMKKMFLVFLQLLERRYITPISGYIILFWVTTTTGAHFLCKIHIVFLILSIAAAPHSPPV